MASQITRVGRLDPDSIPLSRWDQENRGLKPNEISSQPVSHLLVVEIVKVLSTTRQCTRFEVTDYTEVPSISYRRSKTFVCTRWLNDFNRDSTSSLRPGTIIMAEMQFEYFQDKFSGIINRDTDITILKEDSPLALAMKFPRAQHEDYEYTSAPKVSTSVVKFQALLLTDSASMTISHIMQPIHLVCRKNKLAHRDSPW